jgi:hypothetical protein
VKSDGPSFRQAQGELASGNDLMKSEL